MEKNNSHSWRSLYKERFGLLILDPDGWDRKNLKESYSEEISEGEFINRVWNSTIVVKDMKSFCKHIETINEQTDI